MKKRTSSHLSLSRGKTLKLEGLNSRTISFVCNEGTAWITNPGDPKDYIMHPGQVLEIQVNSRRGSVLVESVSGHVELDVFAP